ncbi:glycosyltransferase [Limosilactobacillus reuteri]|uniref:glycosyltransferase n=1 Tax=Limosilactobacillus reuteri TaxID=1598 RepID=UPI00129B32ED|nr:glycosyltransferase [Limosilactobacillus reuteri]MRG63488.1 glycosyltransferase [Limosilactobacillus reuteri]
MRKKIKIMQIGAENFGYGGRSVIAYNLVKNMPTECFQNDFLALKKRESSKYIKELNKNGKVIFVYSSKGNRLLQRIAIDYKIIKALNQGKYDIVHIHADNAYEAMRSVIFSKIAGIRSIVVHAHVSRAKYPMLKNMTIQFCKKLMTYFVDKKVACTNSAGEFMFGKDVNFEVVNDGIDPDKYKFNYDMRRMVRKEFQWEDKIVVGTVARLSPEKNLSFLIRIFKQIALEKENIILAIVGDGIEGKKLRNLCRKLKLDKQVILLGNRDNVSDILQGFDIFALPSLREGFGISILEAQAAGLDTYVSDLVPLDTKVVPDLYHRLSLKSGGKDWVRSIEEIIKLRSFVKRRDTSKYISEKGFDIKQSAKQVEKIYLNLKEKN